MVSQIITIAGVLVGAISSYVATYVLTRQRNRYELSTRWDSRKLDAYEGYVDKVRTNISAAWTLYHAYRDGAHPDSRPESELRALLSEAGRDQSRAFERIMMLGGDDVVEAAHQLNAVVAELVWRARGEVDAPTDEWRQHYRGSFRAINVFHEAVRADLGTRGSVTGVTHPERDILMPPAVREDPSDEC
ncbi:hypothetical protein VMT65_12155 [Nocardia sp. CDC153]|uniref:hypothetical protein n=1 Tax=Nocardia sp. CDC153 TaxID=3112167 RepID=UPI002DB5F54A|nr:hypothetical protein [Nocardia sp. CDC153]MEC3953783.1 hypothetical protein [Nocardia sp. CDC153]